MKHRPSSHRNPLQISRLAMVFGTVLVLIILITSALSIWSVRASEIKKWKKQAEITSLILAENTSYQMSSAYLALNSVAERVQDRWSIDAKFLREKLASNEFHQILKDKLDASPQIEVLSVLDDQGNVISSSRSFPAPGVNLSDRDYFIAQKNTPGLHVSMGKSVRDRVTGKWTFYIAKRLTGSDGEFIGMVVLGISPDFLTRFYEKISDANYSAVTLLRDDFTLLARWPEQDKLMGVKNLTGSTYALVHTQQKKSGVIISSGERMSSGGKNENRMAAIQVLEKYPLIVNFTINEDLYLEEWRRSSLITAAIAAGSILAVIAAFMVMVNLLKRREDDFKITTELKRQADISNKNLAGLLENLTRQQRELEDSSDRLQAVFKNAADGIIMIDDQGKIEAINPAAIRIYGYTPEEMTGRDGINFAPPGKHDLLTLAMSHSTFTQTGQIHIEDERMRKDGSRFPAELSISEYSLSGKRKLIVIVRDVTERYRAEKIKNEFISTVSHELRTPLTAIRGALGLVAGGVLGPLPEKMQPLISMAYKNSESLTRLINDLLDVQKIEAGKIDFHYEIATLYGLLKHAIDSNQSFAREYGVQIVLEDDTSGAAAVRVDPGRFQQVMANLLSNACKYSPKQTTVRVLAQTLPAENKIRIEVIDQGSGIPENFRDRIFQKFSQADSSDTRAKGGTGLGLAISKMIIEQMGGDIGFYHGAGGAAGEGTHFYIELPEHTLALPVA
ncbi:hypothetical protein BH11PSE12_BH11PSE12_07050 [soil metagenome]